MNAKTVCGVCGIQLDPGATEGLCPACLLRGGLEATRTGAEPAAPGVLGNLRYFGNYELLGEIARGGMGVVFKARQASLNRTVAVKAILAGHLADAEAVRRFRTEAEAAANLQHPHIVAIHEIGEQDGLHYFSMDFVDGPNLAQLAGGRPLEATRAAGYVRKVAEAIHYAHQRGTLHRDLKPSNILIDGDDEPRVTDFGLAKFMHRDGPGTAADLVLGTPMYMSPEQAAARADRIGPASDVYSLGAILYELLTGRPPFQAPTAAAVLAKVEHEAPVAPRRLHPAAPADLETICLTCLEKSPHRRYPSARALAEDLGRFLRREPILARPAGRARRAAEWVRHHPWGLLAAGSLLFLALACLAFGLWEQNRLLRWISNHPEFTRARGPRTAALNAAEYGSLWLFVAVLLAQTLPRLRGVKVGELFRTHWNAGPAGLEAASPAMLTGRMVLGGVATLYALLLLARLIAAHVWEGYPLLGTPVGMIYALSFFGPAMIWAAIREQRARLFGRGPAVEQALPPAVEERVREALEGRDPLLAFAVYRRHTACTPAEARLGVARLARKHGLELAPAIISGTRLAAGLGLTAAVAAGLALLLRDPWRVPVLGELGGGWVAGVFILLSMRVKGYWRRVLVFAPGMVVWLVVHDWCKAHHPDQALYGLSLAGMAAAMALLIVSYRKPAPEAG